MRLATRIALAVAAGAALALGALAAEPHVRADLRWPLAPLSARGGSFEARPGANVDLDDAAASARAALPDHAAIVVDWGDAQRLFVARVEGDTSPVELRAWRDASGLALAGPDEASFGGSAPDWFSAPRRGHDLAVTGSALLAAAALVLAMTRSRAGR